MGGTTTVTFNFSIVCSGAAAGSANAVAQAPLSGQLDIPAPTVPAPKAAGEYRIVVSLQYRKVDQFLLNYLLGETNRLTAPVTEIARTDLKVKVRSGEDALRPEAGGARLPPSHSIPSSNPDGLEPRPTGPSASAS